MRVSGNRLLSYPSCRLFNALFFYLGFCFLLIMFVIGRFGLLREVVATKLEIRAVFIDLAVAVSIALFAYLLAMINTVMSVLFLLPVCVFYIASMEMAAALNTFINIADLQYATDPHFMKNSLSVLTFPWYTALLIFSMVIYTISMTMVRKNKLLRLKHIGAGIFVSLFTAFFLSRGEGDWNSSNLLLLSITRSISQMVRATAHNMKTQASPAVVSLYIRYVTFR